MFLVGRRAAALRGLTCAAIIITKYWRRTAAKLYLKRLAKAYHLLYMFAACYLVVN